jgi:peptidoglycan/LPS O-acetylase OafA/YrhL
MAVLTESRLPLLDGVRAIAALSVLVFHAGFWSNITMTGSPAAPFLSRLDVGVSIFFVLSGFLLYRPFVRARLLGTPAPRAVAYGWRRALRILPAYWLALTVVLLVVSRPDALDPGDAVVYYGLVQAYTDQVLGGIAQAWTLCVEVAFYALLPLWALALRRLLPATVRSELLALAVLVAVATAWKLAAVLSAADAEQANASRMLIWLPAYLDQFALGMALAVLTAGGAPRALEWIGRRPWVAWAAAAAAFVLVSVGIGLSPENRLDAPVSAAQVFARHWLYALVGVGVLLPAVAGAARGGAVRRLLGQRWLLYLGLVSYGIYLWHSAAMERAVGAVGRDGSWAAFAAYVAVGFAVAVVVATLSWRVVERPALRLKRLVPDRALPLREPDSHAPVAAPAPSGR